MGKCFVYIISVLLAVMLLMSVSTAYALTKQKSISEVSNGFQSTVQPNDMTPTSPKTIGISGISILSSSLDIYESDNTYTTANWSLTDGIPRNHTFYPSGEHDWVRFNATSNKTYVMWTTNTPGTNTFINFYANGTDLKTGNSSTVNPQLIWFCKENISSYYMDIYDVFSHGGDYNITINETIYDKTLSGGDEFEPDNWFNDSKTMYPDPTPQNRTFKNHTFQYFSNDEDYVNIANLTLGQIYIIETFNTSAGTDTDLQLFENDTSFIVGNEDVGKLYNNNSRIIFKANSTSYYAQVWDRRTKGGNYSVDVYNATSTQAYANGTNISLTFNVTGGAELVKFNATNGTLYTIQTSVASSNVDTYLYLYDENMTALALRENDDIYSPFYSTNSRIVWYGSEKYNGTTMYVLVSDTWMNGGSFNITITNTTNITQGDKYEQDGDLSLATLSYTNGTEQSHSFYPVNEEDWVKFNAINGTSYVIETRNQTSNTDTFITLFDENRTRIDYNDDKSSSNNNSMIMFNCTKNGTYYVQIFESLAYGGNYSISVTQNGYPSVSLSSPISAKNVTHYGTFEFTVNITCNNGTCGNVTATLDPEKQKQITETYSSSEQTEISEPSLPVLETTYETANKTESIQDKSETYLVVLKQEKSSGLSALSVENNFIASISDDIIIEHQYTSMSIVALKLTPEQLADISNNSDVLGIQKSERVIPTLSESVPLINGTNAWNKLDYNGFNVTGANQTVCIIDTGVNYTHINLNHSYLGGYDFCNATGSDCTNFTEDSTPMDGNGHGTHVSGIIVSNATNLTGVAPNASFVMIKVFPDYNGTGIATDDATVIKGINWCIDNATKYNISVISMSLGGGKYDSVSACEAAKPAYKTAIDAATAKGITVVVAAGNTPECNSTHIDAPACIGTSISVGNTDKNDVFSSSSCSSRILNILAPGTSINSTWYNGGFAQDSGTSMAAPHVSGAVLLLNQYYKSNTGQNLNRTQALDVLRDTGKQINDTNTLTFYRIDIANALNNLFSKNVVPMNSGFPFYTIDSNPTQTSCLQNMDMGDSCLVTWRVNATGFLNTTWEFFVDATSNLYGVEATNQSTHVNITIMSTDLAPQINITYPANASRFNASNFWVNATIYSNTSLIQYSQFRLEYSNGTAAMSFLNMSQQNSTHNWYYIFNSSNVSESLYVLNISAYNPLGKLNFTSVVITLDNRYPTIAVNSTFPQYTQYPWLNYTVTDTTPNFTWYSLNNNGNITVNSTNGTGDWLNNVTINLSHAGLQNMTIYANDSFGNINSTTFTFYEFFLMNMTNWTYNTNKSIPESKAILVNNTTDITNNPSVNVTNTTMNLTMVSKDFNITLLNFPSQNATWAAKREFNFTQTNAALKNLTEAAGSNVSKLISVYNISNFLASNFYNTTVEFDGNFTKLRYCANESVSLISSCTPISPCGSGTCYNYNTTSNHTIIYLPNFASIIVENDTTAPAIYFNAPQNTTYSSNAAAYNITVNVTASSDTISCTQYINGTNSSAMSQSGNTFIGYMHQPNNFYNVTVNCTDSFNSNTATSYLTINDTSYPGINTHTKSTSSSSATINIAANEYYYGVVVYSATGSYVSPINDTYCQNWTNSISGSVSDSGLYDRWHVGWESKVSGCNVGSNCFVKTISRDSMASNQTFSLSSLSSGTTYSYGVCMCDYFDNCKLTSSSFSTTTPTVDTTDDTTTDSTNPGITNTTTAVKKVVAYWQNVAPNVDTVWTITSSGIPVKQIIFRLSLAVDSVTVELTNLGANSSATGVVAAPNNVYAYLKIIPSESAYGKVNYAKFTVKVPKSWFTSNNFDSSKLRVYRYLTSDSTWEALPTTALDTSGSEYTYEATSEGFSLFAITAPNGIPEVVANATRGETYSGNATGTLVTSESVNITCGDKVCSIDETCLTCSKDCGTCNMSALTIFTGALSFVKVYWLPLSIGGITIVAAAVFFVMTNKGEGISSIVSLLPRPSAKKSQPEEPKKEMTKKQKAAFELSKQKKTKQVKLVEEKPKEKAPEKKKMFGLFNKKNKKEVIEELKKEPAIFKLK